jgi:thiamine biosynthesis lipoprotein
LLERATPLFGSLVRIRVEGCDDALAMAATSAAVRAMTCIHGQMSFHEPASGLSILNRDAARRAIRAPPHMMMVLAEALAVARDSGGVFDPTVAPLAVRARNLPRPEGAPDPDPAADWRDVELDRMEGTVRFRRPLWLDLGGIAKGYAVDFAVGVLLDYGVPQGCVNAGGDLRVFGPRPETVALQPRPRDIEGARAVRLSNRSLASSGALGHGPQSRPMAVHFDGVRRRRSPRRFVSVMADHCVHADALTKVVLVRGQAVNPLLAAYGASAAVCSATLKWSTGRTPD